MKMNTAVAGFGNSVGEDGEAKPKPSTYIPPEPDQAEGGIFEEDHTQGINFDKYDDIPVEVTGKNKPTRGLST